jgi:hypothetical protein
MDLEKEIDRILAGMPSTLVQPSVGGETIPPEILHERVELLEAHLVSTQNAVRALAWVFTKASKA